MANFFDNPLANMYGPTFLALYGAFIVLVLLSTWWSVRRPDESAALSPLPIPSKKPDPIAVAYLRGGAWEVFRVVMVDLLRRGYLRQDTSGKAATITQTESTPPSEALSSLEQVVYRRFEVPRKAQDVFLSNQVKNEVEEQCKPVEEELAEAHLLTPKDRRVLASRLGWAGALLILALGAYKLGVALWHGRTNVLFLIGLDVVGLIALAVICSLPRASQRGREYLKSLQTAFSEYKTPSSLPDPQLAATILPLSVGLFGVSALAGTELDFIPEMFKRAAASSCGWTGASSGCGSSCGGGGGCGGGGCGGCGG